MGLHVYIYKDNLGDCTNGGVSSWDIKGLTITNVDGPFNPCDEYPSAELMVQECYNRKTYCKVMMYKMLSGVKRNK